MSARYWARVLHGFTWRHCAWAIGLGLLVSLLVRLQSLHINFYFTLWRFVYDTPFYLVYAALFMLAVVCVEASVAPAGWPALWRYFLGAIVASAACIALTWMFSDLKRLAPRREFSGGSSTVLKTFSQQHRATMAVFEMGFDGVVHGWLGTFVYVGLRRARRAAQVLGDAEVARSEAQRALVAAQLLAAHARVDPEFVMRRLDAIESTYEADPAAADRQLDELIAFLRDAIPRWRSDNAPVVDRQG